MIKRKRVYICDHCGAVALQEPYFFMEFAWKGAPKGWTKLGKEDLCPTCSKVYKRFVEELMDSYEKCPNVNLSKSAHISKGEATNA